jgi:hypothetical protein
MTKFADPIFEPPADAATLERWSEERRRRDNVDHLAQEFSFRPSGRDGYIYFKQDERIIELYWEMTGDSASNIRLSLEGLGSWAMPQATRLGQDEQNEILAALQRWLAENGIQADLVPGDGG